jgi:hypothetical protein
MVTPVTAEDEWRDAVVAVGAHGLLNAVTAMVAAARMLERQELSPELRQEMLRIIVERGDVVTDVLRYCLDALPQEARDTINLLDVVDVVESDVPPR